VLLLHMYGWRMKNLSHMTNLNVWMKNGWNDNWVRNLNVSHITKFINSSVLTFHCSMRQRKRELYNDYETWVPLGPHRLGSWPSPTSGSGLPEDPSTC
jgi:hypothetical protein